MQRASASVSDAMHTGLHVSSPLLPDDPPVTSLYTEDAKLVSCFIVEAGRRGSWSLSTLSIAWRSLPLLAPVAAATSRPSQPRPSLVPRLPTLGGWTAATYTHPHYRGHVQRLIHLSLSATSALTIHAPAAAAAALSSVTGKTRLHKRFQ